MKDDNDMEDEKRFFCDDAVEIPLQAVMMFCKVGVRRVVRRVNCTSNVISASFIENPCLSIVDSHLFFFQNLWCEDKVRIVLFYTYN
jgi:hypothetical protein